MRKTNKENAADIAAFERVVLGIFDPDISTPITAKSLCDVINRVLLTGVLKHGQYFPSADHLAKHLNVPKSLVQRVYTQLQDEGTVKAVPRYGTWLISVEQPIARRLDDVCTLAYRLGLSAEDIDAALRAASDRTKKRIRERRARATP